MYNERLSEQRRAAEWEAQRFGLPENWKEGRELVRGLTIDGEGTLDRDDAIAIDIAPGEDGSYRVNISIADVGSFLSPHQTPAIEAYARERGETRYLANGNEPMIPRPISEDALSILRSRGEPETPVLTASAIVRPDGTIEALPPSRQRLLPVALTYREIAAMKAGHGTAEDVKLVQQYEEVAWMLRSHRLNQGAREYVGNSSRPGQMIVEESMLLANRIMAEFREANGIPGLNRNFRHGHAYYSPRPAGHKALGLKGPYDHFTSPLRRFADYVNHANIVAFLEGRDYPYQGEELEDIARHINGIQEKARLRRRLRQRLLGRGALRGSRRVPTGPGRYRRTRSRARPYAVQS
jgi:ribonuclease R